MKSFDVFLTIYMLTAVCRRAQEEDTTSDHPIGTRIFPQVTVSKSNTLKVYLVLSDIPPDGVIITARCSLYPNANLLTKSISENCSSNSATHQLPKRSIFDLNNETPTQHPVDIYNESIDDASSHSMPTSTHRSTTDDAPFFSEAPVWKLQNSEVLFTDSFDQPLIIVRDSYPEVREIEEFLLECCLSASQTEALSQVTFLAKSSVSSILVVDASPFVAVNWSTAPESGTAYPDRIYANPAYIDVSPCSCDCMPQSCDINCCCDKKCDTAAIDSFNCSPKRSGRTSVEGSCSNKPNSEPELSLSPFLCVHSDVNSPYLGTFYVTNPAIQHSSGFFQPRSSRRVVDSHRRQQRQSTTATEQPNPENNYYRYGSPIATVVGPASSSGHLSLPATMFDGKCVTDTSPIAFLMPYSAYCVLPVERLLCTDRSVWSATTYLTARNFSTIRVLSSAASNEEFASVSVRYFCIEEESNSNTDSLDCDPADPTPIFDSSSGTCKNVVTKVRYVITWDGTRLTDIEAIYVLGRVSLAAAATTLTQHFQVTFVPRNSSVRQTFVEFGRSNDTDENQMNYTNATVAFPVFRSGNPGYISGKRLLTGLSRDTDGVVTYNLSDFRFMDLKEDSADRLISRDNGISCGDTAGRSILFGESSYSGCLIFLDDESTTNCSLLRYVVLQHLCNYTVSTYVSKGGNPNINNASDFIPILRNNLCHRLANSSLINDDSDEIYAGDGICLNVPTHLEFTVLYSFSGSVDGDPIFEVRSMQTRHLNSTWQSCGNPSSKNSAVCYSNPSAFNRSSIYLTTSVDFVFVPSNDDRSTKKFWVIQNSLPCSQDTCWSQLAHPFTSSITCDQRAYVTKWGALLIVLFVVVLCVTRGHW